MTLDEAIKHCEEVAEENDRQYSENPEQLGYTEKFYDCKECADEHRQLAEWLKELKKYKEIRECLQPTSPCLKCSEEERAACTGCPDYETWSLKKYKEDNSNE